MNRCTDDDENQIRLLVDVLSHFRIVAVDMHDVFEFDRALLEILREE